jgi:hypothetical protein
VTVTEKKQLEEILASLEGAQKIFIIGCGDCATQCETGGETEVAEMKKLLEEAGKTVTGGVVPDTACEVLLTKKDMRKHQKDVDEADAFLVLSCGAGVQAVSSIVDKTVVPGCNSLFIGDTIRKGQLFEWCSACAECIIGEYAGVCPITRCPKGQMHGPCGGAENGKCEVDPEQDCVWAIIYDRAKKTGAWEKIAAGSAAPRDFRKQTKPRHRVFEPRRMSETKAKAKA